MAALNEKQSKFVKAYISYLEGGMNDRHARKQAKADAGYAESTNFGDIFSEDVCQEIITQSQRRLAAMSIKAVIKQEEILDTPELKSNSNLQAAINSILDRTGIAKKDSKEVTLITPTGVVFLPAKQPLSDSEE